MEYVLYNTYQIQLAVSEKLNCSIWLNDIILEERDCYVRSTVEFITALPQMEKLFIHFLASLNLSYMLPL